MRAPTRLAKRAIHALNRFYFARVGWPGPRSATCSSFASGQQRRFEQAGQ
jgi:hypothetical protein